MIVLGALPYLELLVVPNFEDNIEITQVPFTCVSVIVQRFRQTPYVQSLSMSHRVGVSSSRPIVHICDSHSAAPSVGKSATDSISVARLQFLTVTY